MEDEDRIEVDARWARSAFTALERTIPARLKKKFVDFMFRARFWDRSKLSTESAISRLNESLRDDEKKSQFLKISEVWAWMRYSGEHELFKAMAEDLGYRIERIPSETLIADTLSKIDRSLWEASEAFGRAERLRDQLAQLTAANREPVTLPVNVSSSGFRFCRDGDGETLSF